MAQEFDITYSKRVDYVTRNVVAETKEEAWEEYYRRNSSKELLDNADTKGKELLDNALLCICGDTLKTLIKETE